MSFTNNIKNELVKLSLTKLEEISELSSLIKNTIDKNYQITIENASLAKLIFQLLKKNYNLFIKVSVRNGYNYNKNYIYVLDISKNNLGLLQELALEKIVPDDYLVDDEDLKRAYLRGLFLACGSINDPSKSRYHLEFTFAEYEYANFINNFLNSYNLNSKILKRENRYMVYIKESEKIGDFLRLIKATNALLYYENMRIYRSRKNVLNRINNCEQANVDKIIQTAKNQVDDINLLKETGVYDLLDDKLKEVCDYRLKYPEVSLLELSKIMTIETNNSITKSGLHHRFNKIKTMASNVKEKI